MMIIVTMMMIMMTMMMTIMRMKTIFEDIIIIKAG